MLKADAFTPLRVADFRRFWVGLCVSMIGSNLRNAALLWHITLLVEPDQRAVGLGMVGLVRALGIVSCGLFAGVLADAVDRRRLLFLINTGLFVVSCVLALATALGYTNSLLLYGCSALFAIGGTFDNPARNAYYPMLVPRSELPRAIVLNGAAFQSAAVLGPALAGALIARFGMASAYAVDAVSFLAFAVNLLRVKTPGLSPAEGRAQLRLSALMDGVRFVFGHALIRSSMLLDFVATFFASATALLPLYAQDVLQVGAGGYGALSAAIAVGSVTTGLLASAQIERTLARGKLLFTAVALYGVATCAFAYSHSFWLSFLSLVCVGAADVVSTVIRQLIRQLETPDALRGRMAGVNLIFFMGGPQLGELEAGLAAHALGLEFSVFLGGSACLLFAAIFAYYSPLSWSYRRSE